MVKSFLPTQRMKAHGTAEKNGKPPIVKLPKDLWVVENKTAFKTQGAN